MKTLMILTRSLRPLRPLREILRALIAALPRCAFVVIRRFRHWLRLRCARNICSVENGVACVATSAHSRRLLVV